MSRDQREGSSRAPGAMLLHPLALVSLVVLLVNDHVLKALHPSALTGKLSDLAGVFLLPLVLQALVGVAVTWRRGHRPAPALDNQIIVACVAATLVGFALPELWAPAERLYRFGLGALQWPYHAATALFDGRVMPGIRPVRATADVTDLAALPMALVALKVAWRTPVSRRRVAASHIAMLLAVWCCAAPDNARAEPTSSAAADEGGERAPRRGERTHDGFYLDVELGVGALFVDSDASISNGFRQSLPASARGVASPWLTFALGGTLRPLNLVLGGRYGRARASTPVVRTLGQSFEVDDLALELTELAFFGRYYPDPAGGLSFGASIGYLAFAVGPGSEFEVDPAVVGEEQEGASVSAESSYTFWISRQLSAGGSVRVLAARLEGHHGTTLLLAPALLGSLVWH